MNKLRKDILREAIHICKESGLYHVFTSQEKRETVMHIYNLISETAIVERDESVRAA